MGIESPIHLIFIGIVALLVLGPRRLPELARRLGEGVRELRDAIDAGAEHHDNPPEQPASATPPAPAPAAATPAAPAPAATPSVAPTSVAPPQPPGAGDTPPQA
jgi:sec-independent protein translocase protein TatA